MSAASSCSTGFSGCTERAAAGERGEGGRLLLLLPLRRLRRPPHSALAARACTAHMNLRHVMEHYDMAAHNIDRVHAGASAYYMVLE